MGYSQPDVHRRTMLKALAVAPVVAVVANATAQSPQAAAASVPTVPEPGIQSTAPGYRHLIGVL